MEHLLARQQEIHELVRRNTHQAQLRQKLKFDRHLKAKAHAVGDAVWVFCHIIPKGGTRKLIRAWRGPHNVTNVLQDGRLYVLDTGQKVHYERLKRHVPAPWDWTTYQPFGLDQNVAIIADPYVEDTNEEITSDISRDSFLPEQLPEASFEMEPTRPVPPRTIQTRTQTALGQGVPRRRFSQFDYPSESDSEAEAAEPPPMTPPSQVVFPEVDDLEPLFSDQDEILPPTLIESLIPSPSGTSAPLLSNPSLTDTLSNFPLFNQQTTHPNEPTDPIQATEPLDNNDGPDHQIANPNPPPTTTTRRGRPRGRPPARRNQLPTSSSRTTTSSRKPTTRPRRGPRTRFSSRTAPRTLDRAMTLPQIPESSSPAQSPQLDDNSRQTPRYQLRTNRAPRYKCGTCGSRNCSCVQLVTTETPRQRLARGAAIPDCEFLLAQTANHPQHKILNVRTKLHNSNITPTVRHIILTIEKTFTSTESESIPPLESTLKEMHRFSPSDCPTYRFKEWTSHEKGGLQFTLAAIIPPLPPSFSFGELDDTCSNPLMIRCITANQLWQKYHITSPPGDVYQPSTGWWLLVTSLDDSSLFPPTTLLLCLENLRTLVESNDTLCFHLADTYRGKFLSQHWLQLIAIVFCRQTKICILDRLTYTPEIPISPLEALSVMHSWS